MDYLIRAEQYAEAQGDGALFRSVYTRVRENCNIKLSVWLTLKDLYSDLIADQLQEL
jgi:hypothetical protein